MSARLVSLAAAASWSGSHGARRRALMLAAAAAVLTVIGSGCVSAWLLSTRIDERARARAFHPAGQSAPSLERSALFDETSTGEQIYVYWWRILDAQARIPGVPADPPIDSWFVSPALQQLMATDPGVAERYAGAQPIGKQGVSHRDELLAYRFVDHDLDRSQALSLRPGLDWIGDGTEVVELFPIAVAALALIGVSGLGLTLAALAPFGAVLERRDSILDALGASRGVRRSLAIIHAALCAGPGAVVAAAAWFLLSPRLTAVPLVGRRVFGSDLAIPISSAALVAAGVVGMTMMVAAARPRRAQTNRPSQSVPRVPTAARSAPLLLGLAIATVGVFSPGQGGAKVFLVGVVVVALGTVVALPYLLHRVGTRIARYPRTLTLLLGRRLRWDAESSARSLVAVGTLAVLLPLVAAWVTVARSLDEPTTTDAYAVELRGPLPVTEMRHLAAQTGALPLQVVTADEGPPEPHLVGDCRSLASLLAFTRCDSSFELARPASFALGSYERLPGVPSAPTGSSVRSTLFLSSNGPAVERTLRSFVVNGTVSRLQVAAPGRAVFHESPLVAWILGAAMLAGLVGACAILLHLATQAARSARSRMRLLAIGADLPTLRWLASGEAALAVASVGLACTFVGAVCSWLFVQKDPSATVPYAVIAYVLAGTMVIAGVVGVAAGSVVRGDRRSAQAD